MTFNFTDETPVKIAGTGKTAAPNPYKDVIAAIALKTDDKGKPIAKGHVVDYDDAKDGQSRTTVINRIKRQTSDAGEANTPAVTVRSDITDVKDDKGNVIPGKLKVVFWTIKRVERPRKAKTEDKPTETATTPQSTAVAKPAK